MTADQLQLLTAAVDGELSATDRRALRALLAASAEARALLQQLHRDRARLNALPAAAPPADLLARVLARLADATPAPRTPVRPLAEPAGAPAAARRRESVWVSAAVAASLLFAATAGTLAYLHTSRPSGPVARNDGSNARPAPSAPPAQAPNTPHAGPGTPDTGNSQTAPAPREAVAVAPPAVALAPSPRAITPDLIGFPVLPKLPPLERVEVRIPFLRPVADLGREDIAHELREELDRDLAFRFDLFVRDTARGVEVFQNTARAAGLGVLVDAATHERLKKRGVQSVVVYTESFTAAELVAFLGRLSAEDAKFSPRVCDALHATPVVRADELELKAVLGTDVGLYKRPAGTGTGSAGEGSDRPMPSPSRSVNSETIDSVVKSVAGSPKAPDKLAVLTTWQPGPGFGRTVPGASQELKQFFQKRGDRKPNAVPAVIVIRPAG